MGPVNVAASANVKVSSPGPPRRLTLLLIPVMVNVSAALPPMKFSTWLMPSLPVWFTTLAPWLI